MTWCSLGTSSSSVCRPVESLRTYDKVLVTLRFEVEHAQYNKTI